MSAILRVILLLAAVAFAGYILLKIRKCKVKMEDAIFWICLAVVLLIMGIFPKVTYWLTGLFHMQSPANLIFLIIIFLLLEKVLTLSIITSQMEEKIMVLSAEVALRSHDNKGRSNTEEEQIQKINAAGSIAVVQNTSVDADGVDVWKCAPAEEMMKTVGLVGGQSEKSFSEKTSVVKSLSAKTYDMSRTSSR